MSSAPETLPQQPPVRVLSLDSGGIRGLSSLIILRKLMNRIAYKRGIVSPVRPCDYFDLIVGTGTGGISALLLGRMRMTVDEAIEEYIGVAEKAFVPSSTGFGRHFWSQSTSLEGGILNHAVGDVAEKFLGDRDGPLKDPRDGSTRCRTAVLAATIAYANAPPYIFRSYNTKHPASLFTIHEAARATASTSGLFDPVSLGNPPIQFTDAGLSGYNNPTQVALNEAAALWPGQAVGCLVSIGTGLQDIASVDQGWAGMAKACTEVMRSCESVHDRVFRAQEHSYFRFNVDRGLGATDVMEWNQAASGSLGEITEAYMRWGEVERRIDACVDVLVYEEIAMAPRSDTPPPPYE